MLKIGNSLPMYPGKDELLVDLNDLGYKSIELDDLIDMLEDDNAWIEYWYEPATITLVDELSFMSPAATKAMHSLMDGRRKRKRWWHW